MAVLKRTVHDNLIEDLMLALDQIVECDDPDEDFPELRRKAHVALGEVLAQAAIAGYNLVDLYEYVIGMEEGRADLAANGPWGNGQFVQLCQLYCCSSKGPVQVLGPDRCYAKRIDRALPRPSEEARTAALGHAGRL